MTMRKKSRAGISTTRTSSASRGYNYQWQKARKVFLQKHPLCIHCQDEGQIKAADVVDHIEPHKGDSVLFWNEANWQPLCYSHHSIKTAREDGGFGNKKSTTKPGCNEHGIPLDNNSHWNHS